MADSTAVETEVEIEATDASTEATAEATAEPEEIASLADAGSTEIAAEEGDGFGDIVSEDDYVYNAFNSDIMLSAIGSIDADAIAEEETTESEGDDTEISGAIGQETRKLGSYSTNAFSTGYTFIDGYVNEFFGIDFDLPSGWVMGNSYDLTQLNSGFSGAYSDSDTKVQVDNGEIVTVMAAASESGYNYAVVEILNREALMPYATTTNDFLNAMAQAYASYYPSVGYTDVTVTNGVVNAMGETDVACIEVSGTKDYNTFYFKEIFVANGSYIASITVTTNYIDSTDLYLSFFDSL